MIIFHTSMVHYNFKVFCPKEAQVSQPPFVIGNAVCYLHITNKETKSQNFNVFPKAI